jgi:hypothetical protein
MPEFDLGRAKAGEYRLVGLPDVGCWCDVYLAIRSPDKVLFAPLLEDTLAPLNAAVRLEVIDSTGRNLATQEGKLSTFIITQHYPTFALLYQCKDSGKGYEGLYGSTSAFRAMTSESYVIRLSYTPDLKLRGYRGFVYVDCQHRY